jgi:hypothetical protein
MSRIIFICLGFIVASATTIAQAYELETHRRLTRLAFEDASTAPGTFAAEVGHVLDSFLRGFDGRLLTASEWVQEGSVREDDTLSTFELARVRHHFYDPVHDQPLTKGIQVGFRVFDWALEEPEPIVRQSFSWKDGRRAFLRALTAEDPATREHELAHTFRILGHVMHLVQDAAVPEHTRNDWHAGKFPPLFPAGTPSLYEARVDQQLETYLDDGFLADYGPRSFPRLRDYWATGSGTGLSEFTNRSFVSKGTNFRALEEGATGHDPESGRSYPFPRLELARRSVEEVTVDSRVADSAALAGAVTFFGNEYVDLTTGESEPNTRLTSFGLFDADLVARQMDPLFTLNRYNVDAAAGILLRRAVGYSAGLLDHFFRTRLEVSVLEADQADPSLVRLEGVNAGPDAMHDGRLLLYADDASGRRAAVAAVGAHPPVAAGPGEPILSGVFQLPPDVERLVAVYRGGLGTEEPVPTGAAAPEIPGAVIARTLGGHRVEHVFPDWDTGRWTLRTPTGSFPLPISTDDIVDLRWGDADNMLVGRTAFGRLFGEPNEVVAYEIRRAPGSTAVPLLAGVVHVEERQRRRFPFGVPAGVRVHLAHAVELEQKLVTFAVTEEYVDSTRTAYAASHRGIESFRDSKVLTAAWDLALDLDKLDANARPHRWTLMHAALQADGTLLAVVRVRLTQPTDPNAFATFTTKMYASPTPGCVFPCPAPVLTDGATIGIPYHFPSAGDIAVVVDVTNSRVLYTTAPEAAFPGGPSVVSLAHTTRHTRYNNGSASFAAVAFHEVTRITTDPARTVTGFAYGPTGNHGGFPCDPAEGFVRLDTVPAVAGTTALAASRFPAAIAAKDGPGTSWHEVTADRFCVAAVTETTFGYDVVTDRPLRFLTGLSLERFARAPGVPDRLVFQIIDPRGPSAVFSGRIVFWDPEDDVATMHRIETAEAAGILHLDRDAAWFTASTTSHYVPREDTAAPRTFVVERDVAEGFRILDGRRLYSADTLRFHGLDPALQRTALPARVLGTGNREGSYHAITLR